MWCSFPPELLFTPHVLSIMVVVKASRPPYVLMIVVGIVMDMRHGSTCSNQSPPRQVSLTDIIVL